MRRGYRTPRLAAIAAVLLALELTLLETWSVGDARPEALLALACFAALFARDARQGLTAAWLVGLIKDVGSSGPLGLHALLFLVAAWTMLQVRQVIFRESAVTQFGVAFAAACGVHLVSALLVAVGTGGLPLGMVAGKTLVSALLTAVAAPPLHLLLRHVKWLVR